jgi:hypothetical protein
MRVSTSSMPRGKRVCDGCHSPTLSHHAVPLSYQPASMQNTSAPAAAAASMSGSSFPVVGSPMRVFM